MKDSVKAVLARFTHVNPPILYFVTNTNKLNAVAFTETGPIVSSFFTHDYCYFDTYGTLLFAVTPEGMLHVYSLIKNPPQFLMEIPTTKYLPQSYPLAVSSAYIAFPTYDVPATQAVSPPQYTSAMATEALMKACSWIKFGVKSMVSTQETQPQEKQVEEDVKNEYVRVIDYRTIETNKTYRKIAHFCSTVSRNRILKFDHKGELLLTADDKGNTANVYRIYPDGKVDSLFILRRGATVGIISDVSFSCDCSTVTVSSTKTTHLFILPLKSTVGAPAESSIEDKQPIWLESDQRFHSNGDADISTMFTKDCFVQCVGTDISINSKTKDNKYVEKAHIDIGVNGNYDTYVNEDFFKLPTILGQDEFYHSPEKRIIPYNETTVKELTKSTNKFAIGKASIERQKTLLEKTMKEWVSATTNIFDSDYCTEEHIEANTSDTLKSDIVDDVKEEPKDNTESKTPIVLLEPGTDEVRRDVSPGDIEL